MTSLDFGPFGIATGLTSSPESLSAARVAEELGYPAIWLSGGPLPGLQTITDLIEATSTIRFVSGILSVDNYSAADVASAYAGLEASAPGRFTVGLGGAHGAHPIATLNGYLDQLDAVPTEGDPARGVPAAEGGSAQVVPAEHRLLAALGPRMLELARERTAGAYPFLITPEYTAEARKTLGPDKLLTVSHLAVLETDPDRARAIARGTISFFPRIPGYAASLKRQGFTDADLTDLPDHLVDSLAAWGTPAQIAEKLHAHHTAGADHVAVNVITGVTGPQPIDEWRALAPALLP
ncbi:TIGR03620 family F420-dependent LLM class oxidoreductase [Streptomyces sp. SID13031]|uniref:TIGR03620 family F420-dependent LLM class oxidoreductase n=1 Tax=Streptomyces sp. SID13031 TaxID=2706046 RepID=UPI0013CC18F5|nr:TIGR03620 family F420-dependent LLM class oxidoreductase [Streptomyces sp. SID13031]NEA35446.1 TIGR03620 family F420-dependent LLM class oxidoreductase [Streptomyces sp. SID13031]